MANLLHRLLEAFADGESFSSSVLNEIRDECIKKINFGSVEKSRCNMRFGPLMRFGPGPKRIAKVTMHFGPGPKRIAKIAMRFGPGPIRIAKIAMRFGPDRNAWQSVLCILVQTHTHSNFRPCKRVHFKWTHTHSKHHHAFWSGPKRITKCTMHFGPDTCA